MSLKINITFRNSTKHSTYKRVFFNRIVSSVFEEVRLKDVEEIQLSISIIGEKRMKTLNNNYRGEDKSTDVLSFGLIDNLHSQKLVINGILNIGDLFVSVPFIVRTFGNNKIAIKKEVTMLTVHGILHLLGYDHGQANKKKQMFALQERILNSID